MKFDGKKIPNIISNLRNIGLIGVSDIISSGITGIFWLYIASILNPEEYGELSYLISLAAMASVFSLIGTQNTIIVFSSKKIEIIKALQIFSLLGSSIGLIALLILFERIDIGLLCFGYVLSTLSIGNLLGTKNFMGYAKYQLLQKILTVCFGLLAIIFFDYQGLIIALALSYAPYILQIIKTMKNSKTNLQLFKTKSSFISSNYFIYVTDQIAKQFDKIIIMPLLGAAVLGNYSLSLQILGILTIFSTIAFKYILPYDSTNVSTTIIKKGIIIISLIITVLGFFLTPIVIPSIFPKYAIAVDSIQILCLAVLPVSLYTILASKIYSIEKTVYLLYAHVLSASIMIIGIFILGAAFNIVGLASTFVLSQTSTVIFLYAYLKKSSIKI